MYCSSMYFFRHFTTFVIFFLLIRTDMWTRVFLNTCSNFTKFQVLDSKFFFFKQLHGTDFFFTVSGYCYKGSVKPTCLFSISSGISFFSTQSNLWIHERQYKLPFWRFLYVFLKRIFFKKHTINKLMIFKWWNLLFV